MKLIKLVVLILGMMSSQCVNAEWSDFLETFTSMWSGEQYEAYFNDRPWTLTAWLTYMGVAFDTTWDEEYEEYDPNNYDMSIGSVYEVHNDLPWRNGDPWLVLFYTDGCKKCDAVLDWYPDVAYELKDIAYVGKIEVKHAQTYKKYDVKNTPRAIFFTGGKVIRGKHNVDYTVKNLVEEWESDDGFYVMSIEDMPSIMTSVNRQIKYMVSDLGQLAETKKNAMVFLYLSGVFSTLMLIFLLKILIGTCKVLRRKLCGCLKKEKKKKGNKNKAAMEKTKEA